MREVRVWDGGLGVPGHGLEDPVRGAVDSTLEALGVGPVPDPERCGAGPLLLVLWVWSGEGGDLAGVEVWDEGWVGGDVGDDVEEVGGVVGEDAGGGEGLSGGEGRAGREGAGR